MKKLLIICLVLLGSVQFSSVYAALPSKVDDQALPSLAPMVEKVTPSVVNISARGHASIKQNPLLNDPFFRRFFNVPQRPQRQQEVVPQALGSGVIIDAEKGYVITNNHVVKGAEEISVTTRDGRQLNAKLVGTDPEADIAVLKVPAEGLHAIKVADSTKLRVGDFVVAIGNPFGLGQTVTSGIVSALGRSGLGIEGYEDFIQTDASINPGNSGGALVNLRGELVGINTAILAPSGGNVGIGFAIPMNMVSQIVEQLVQHGEVKRGFLGVVMQDLTPDLAKAFDLKLEHGAVISRVVPDSPAHQAGIQPGDVVTKINGEKIRGSMDMRNAVGLVRIGQTLRIHLIRNGKPMDVKATIREPKRQSVAGEVVSPRLKGATFSQLPDDQDTNLLHIVITDVEQGSPAWYARLQKGDEILSVNRHQVNNLDDLKKYANGSGQLLLNIQRGSSALFLLLN